MSTEAVLGPGGSVLLDKEQFFEVWCMSEDERREALLKWARPRQIGGDS